MKKEELEELNSVLSGLHSLAFGLYSFPKVAFPSLLCIFMYI